jgi:hypothetical protein
MWLMRIPPRSTGLIVGPIDDQVAAVLATHFTATYRWSGDVSSEAPTFVDQADQPTGVGAVVITAPWPAKVSPRRQASLAALFRLIREDGCLLLLTDESLDSEEGDALDAEAALRSAGFSQVQRYLVEPAHATPRSIVPLVPATIAHHRDASRGVQAALRSLRDRVLKSDASRCAGLVAYR